MCRRDFEACERDDQLTESNVNVDQPKCDLQWVWKGDKVGNSLRYVSMFLSMMPEGAVIEKMAAGMCGPVSIGCCISFPALPASSLAQTLSFSSAVSECQSCFLLVWTWTCRSGSWSKVFSTWCTWNMTSAWGRVAFCRYGRPGWSSDARQLMHDWLSVRIATSWLDNAPEE